ncbi:sugar phosphate nucleotidyltransferase [Candidatus Nanosalina sp. VS9-1]|uniref:sugar phosphate nucleotidyltransferase n=1 Tax=Candidatus Nanosalina sp. VS9-1 TaxID=3388566 RepID=UPI0039DF7EC6
MYYLIAMKAIILAGGHATRLWPVTKHRAKPLLPLGEKPIIEYILDDLEGEVDEVIISTNDKFAPDFDEYVEASDFEDVRVVSEDQDNEHDKPGTIGAIINLIESEGLSDDLVIVGGDNYQSFDGADFIEFVKEKDAPANVVYDVESEEMASQFGIVDVDDDRIVGFKEKPDVPPSTLASIAWYFFPEEDLDLFDRYEEHFAETDIPEDQYLDEPGRLIEWAHEEREMYAYSFDGEWFDVGTPQGYLNAVASITDDKIVEGTVKDSEVDDDSIVMEGAEVKNSKVKKSIVFPNAKIIDSEVRNSILDQHAKIKDVNLNDALIGEHTQL